MLAERTLPGIHETGYIRRWLPLAFGALRNAHRLVLMERLEALWRMNDPYVPVVQRRC